MSKGSEYRPYNKKKFDQEYDRIFGKKKTKEKEKKHQGVRRIFATPAKKLRNMCEEISHTDYTSTYSVANLWFAHT